MPGNLLYLDLQASMSISINCPFTARRFTSNPMRWGYQLAVQDQFLIFRLPQLNFISFKVYDMNKLSIVICLNFVYNSYIFFSQFFNQCF